MKTVATPFFLLTLSSAMQGAWSKCPEVNDVAVMSDDHNDTFR
jgi:hypothetical protein